MNYASRHKITVRGYEVTKKLVTKGTPSPLWPCLLCGDAADVFYTDPKEQRRYFRCQQCDYCFLEPNQRLSRAEEHRYYELHQNDVADVRYQKFVSPLVEKIIADYPEPGKGLDFGCGPGPVASHLLQQQGFTMCLYDPLFQPNREALGHRYDFILCSEVFEHLHHPYETIRALLALVQPGGGLYVMTSLLQEHLDFASWHYRRDPTHVGFFSVRTFAWIAQSFGGLQLWHNGRQVAVLYLPNS